MSPDLAALLVAGLVGVTAAVGLATRGLGGRRRAPGRLRVDPADALGEAEGVRVTIVQFSTEFCTRCPQVRRLLAGYADADAGVAHVEVDLTHRPDLASKYRVLQTPTTLLVDASGEVRARFHGVPHRRALTDALAAV